VDGGLALEAAGDGLGQGPQRQGAQLRHRQRHSRLSLRRRLGPERGIRLPLLVESKATGPDGWMDSDRSLPWWACVETELNGDSRTEELIGRQLRAL